MNGDVEFGDQHLELTSRQGNTSNLDATSSSMGGTGRWNPCATRRCRRSWSSNGRGESAARQRPARLLHRRGLGPELRRAILVEAPVSSHEDQLRRDRGRGWERRTSGLAAQRHIRPLRCSRAASSEFFLKRTAAALKGLLLPLAHPSNPDRPDHRAHRPGAGRSPPRGLIRVAPPPGCHTSESLEWASSFEPSPSR